MAEKLCVHCGETINFLTGAVTSHGPLHHRCSHDFYGTASIRENQSEGQVNPDAQANSSPTIHSEPRYETAEPKYETARGVASFIAAIGWLLVVGGIIAAIPMGFKIGPAGYFAAFVVAFSGLITIMGAQVVKATVDTADNTRGILEEMKRQR